MSMDELKQWIRSNTAGYERVIECGAGFFDKLSYALPSKKVGIEIHKPYIDAADYNDCEKIHGSFLDFEELVPSASSSDCVMFIDTIEHVTKEDALALIAKLKSLVGRIMIFAPEGEFEAKGDPHNMGGDEYQEHKSTWTTSDFLDNGFQDVRTDKDFHSWVKLWGEFPDNSTVAVYAVWTK